MHVLLLFEELLICCCFSTEYKILLNVRESVVLGVKYFIITVFTVFMQFIVYSSFYFHCIYSSLIITRGILFIRNHDSHCNIVPNIPLFSFNTYFILMLCLI